MPRPILQRESLPFRSAGLNLHAERWTPESPLGTVVFLHGGGQTRHSWDTTATEVAQQGWTTVTYDARGHGDSDWADGSGYGTGAGVADLRALLATLNTKPILVGASMGGLVSIMAVDEDPQLASAIVLVDIVPRMEPTGRDRIRNFMLSHRDGFASLDEVADAVEAYSNTRRRARNLDGLRKNVRQQSDGRWYWHWDPALLDVGDESSLDARFAQIDAAASRLTLPILIVRGARSDIVSDAGVQELRDALPHAKYMRVDAGHMVAGDDNAVFAEGLVRFLEEVSAGTARSKTTSPQAVLDG